MGYVQFLLEVVGVLNGLTAVLRGAGVAAEHIGIAFFRLMRKIAQSLNIVLDRRLFLFAKHAQNPSFRLETLCVEKGFFMRRWQMDKCNKFELPAICSVRKKANGVQ